MKSIARFTFTIVAITLLLAACGPTPVSQVVKETVEVPVKETVVVEQTVVVEATEEPVEGPEELTLTMLHNMGPDAPVGPTFQSIVDEFAATHPDITIEQQLDTGENVETLFETAYLAGEEPDIVMHNYLGPVRTWLADGLIIPLETYAAEWGLADRLLDDAVEQYTNADGHLEGIPMMGYNWPVWYNTAILAEAGLGSIPLTHDELIEAASKVRAAGYQPFATGGSDWTGAQDFEFIIMARLAPDQIQQLFDNGGWSADLDARAAVEAFVALRDAGVFVDNVEGLEFSSRNEMFFSGKAAMMHGGSWNYGEVPDELVDDIVLGGFPLPPGSPYERPTWWNAYLVKGLYVSRNGANKIDAIGEFVKFLYQPENIARLVEAGSFLPVIKDVLLDEQDLAPLFIKSLNLTDELGYILTADEVVPGDLWAGWDRIGNSAYVPGTSGEELLKAMDLLYETRQ